MELGSRFVGTPLKDLVTQANWRRTMNYAAAVGDANPRYFDDDRPGGIIAPPLFAVALTWAVIEKIWEHIQDKDFPFDVLATMVHYREHLHFHRPVNPGDTLTLKGTIAAILPHRAGTQVVLRFDAVDAGANPVFTEHMAALLRGVTCTDNGAGQANLPWTPAVPDKGPSLWDVPVAIDSLLPFVYDGCTDIVFPIHTSTRFARQVGLPGIIVQGTATLALAAKEIVNREAGADPTRLKALSCRFSGMVMPATTIRVALVARQNQPGQTELHFAVFNGQGQKAISDGIAVISDWPAKSVNQTG